MEGWIRLHRKILDNPIVCKDSDTIAIWLYLLLNATYQEIPATFKGKKIILKKGQLITGIISISEKLVINKNKVQRTLKCFESDKQIEQQTSNKNRLITILNWEMYQSDDKQNDKQMINKWETNDKQSDNKQEYNKKEKNKEVVIVEEDVCKNDFREIVKFYEENIGLLTPHGAEVLNGYAKDFPKEVIIYAMKKADEANVRTMDYIRGILNNWQKAGVKSLIQAQKETEKFKNKKSISKVQIEQKKGINAMEEFLNEYRGI